MRNQCYKAHLISQLFGLLLLIWNVSAQIQGDVPDCPGRGKEKLFGLLLNRNPTFHVNTVTRNNVNNFVCNASLIHTLANCLENHQFCHTGCLPNLVSNCKQNIAGEAFLEGLLDLTVILADDLMTGGCTGCNTKTRTLMQRAAINVGKFHSKEYSRMIRIVGENF